MLFRWQQGNIHYIIPIYNFREDLTVEEVSQSQAVLFQLKGKIANDIPNMADNL